jgi:hypothetical protein
MLGPRRGEVVAGEPLMRQKLGAEDSAHSEAAQVFFRAGGTPAVEPEPRHRVDAARDQRLTEHVPFGTHGARVAFGGPGHTRNVL